MRNHTKCLLKTTVLGLACLGALAPTPVAVAADPDLPEPGLYWRAPRPDGLGNLNYAVGASARLHAAPVELARVDRVVYFAGGSEIGQVANPPYAFDWTVAGSGAVSLRAEARDGTGAVQGWCERTIQVIGEGLQVAQSALAVTVATGATATVNLDLTNLGPGDTEWAIHVQGGLAPGGTAGNIVRAYTNPVPFSQVTYRHRGTAATADDEVWMQDWSVPDPRINVNRRSAGDWSDLGLYTAQSPVLDKAFFIAADGDGLWGGFIVPDGSGHVGFALLDATTGVEQRRMYLPEDGRLSYWIMKSANSASGVFYIRYNLKDGESPSLCSMAQVRDRDGMVIVDHGGFPSWPRGTYDGGRNLNNTCWAEGHLWLIDCFGALGTIDIYRWHPGMTDPVKTVSIPCFYTDQMQRPFQRVCGTGEPGFLWVADYTTDVWSGVKTTPLYMVDTGLRPWLRLAEPRGTLANGAGRAVSITIDATTAPTGTYHAVLAITQYPNSLIPQIPVPVTLTVTSGGSNQPPTLQSPAWAEAPAVTLPAGTTVHVVANDPDGDPLIYAWSKVSGPGTATFATPTAAASGVTFSAPGAYVLRVGVSDGNGGSVTSDVSVAVTSDVDARADCNGDGVVNALDLQIVIANFGQTVP